ncbi:hypothetical protein [Limnospira platensis]|uniref:hypothetical protein n=1 Tax=Limnospira platensis TaxID=118562 RepID=UPI003D6DBA3D
MVFDIKASVGAGSRGYMIVIYQPHKPALSPPEKASVGAGSRGYMVVIYQPHKPALSPPEKASVGAGSRGYMVVIYQPHKPALSPPDKPAISQLYIISYRLAFDDLWVGGGGFMTIPVGKFN